MEYINKRINIEEGNSYSSDYLYDSFNEEEQCFHPSVDSKQAYKNFSHKKYRYGEGLTGGRKGLEPLLVEEQNHLCCYCMGKIKTKSVALEHIIPESFDGLKPEEEFDFYARHAPIIAENVVLSSSFAQRVRITSKKEIKAINKYPHLISYVNLTASCHGIIDNHTSCFCNNPRGNKRIIPLTLMKKSSSIVSYDQQGLLIIKDLDPEEIRLTVKALNLNHETLVEIRVLWYKISHTQKTVAEINSIKKLIDKISLLKSIFGIDDYTLLEEKWRKYAPIPKYANINTHNATYWELFLKYEWFYHYYKREQHL